MAGNLLVSLFMIIFISLVQVYTYITLPFYFFWQAPWKARARDRRCRITEYIPPNKNRIDELHRSLIDSQQEASLSPIYTRNDAPKPHPMLHETSLVDVTARLIELHGPDQKVLGKNLGN